MLASNDELLGSKLDGGLVRLLCGNHHIMHLLLISLLDYSSEDGIANLDC